MPFNTRKFETYRRRTLGEVPLVAQTYCLPGSKFEMKVNAFGTSRERDEMKRS